MWDTVLILQQHLQRYFDFAEGEICETFIYRAPYEEARDDIF